MAGVATPAVRPADSKSVRPRATSSLTYGHRYVSASLQRPLAISLSRAPAPYSPSAARRSS